MHRPIVYVSGPYSGPTILHVLVNIWRARRAALAIWRAGGAAICPHMNTALFTGLSHEDWLAGDCEMVRRSDVIYMLPGWRQSPGACLEHDAAFDTGVERCYSLEDTRLFLAWQRGELDWTAAE